jgi:hypothetical protein
VAEAVPQICDGTSLTGFASFKRWAAKMFVAPGSKIFLREYLPEADLALASATGSVAAL